MSRIIGDRREKSALDEMEEVARARNADVAEEERLEALRKAEGKEAPSEEPVVVLADNIIPASYRGLEFEAKSPKERGNKKLWTYEESLARIKKAGYERHPSPAEAFSLIADNLEGKLKGKLKTIAEDIISGYGEWLSMAFERKGNLLIAYLHPEGLRWNGGIYDRKNFTYSEKKEFGIARMKKKIIVPLQEMGDEFALFVYSRKFADLPRIMKEGNAKSGKAEIGIPEDGNLWPVKRNMFRMSISRLFIDGIYSGEASRGVRVGGSQ
ncbi:MAG: hypothetical protein WC852_02560 [Candidatus Nanoarchaeia archaeon]|jgi:hypothetical protein